MLKIKDDKDLKELEKFGFSILYDTYTGKPYAVVSVRGFPYCDNVKKPFIKFVKKKYIGFRSEKKDIWVYDGKIPSNRCNVECFFDILYDLIQAGLIEKE